MPTNERYGRHEPRTGRRPARPAEDLAGSGPAEFNYGPQGSQGGSSFSGRSQGGMGGVWRDSYSGGAGVRLAAQAARAAAGRGVHVGRGPKGYRRSDEAIADDIDERLTRHPDLDATDIEVRVMNGEVSLTGEVDGRDT